MHQRATALPSLQRVLTWNDFGFGPDKDVAVLLLESELWTMSCSDISTEDRTGSSLEEHTKWRANCSEVYVTWNRDIY